MMVFPSSVAVESTMAVGSETLACSASFSQYLNWTIGLCIEIVNIQLE